MSLSAGSSPSLSTDEVVFYDSMNLTETGNGVYSALVPTMWTNGIGAAHGGWLLALNLNAVLKEVGKLNKNLSHPISVNSQVRT